ncbi:MAG: DNA-binding LytR/AlgR family response regulator [Bacteroidia bacterium]
MVEDMAFTRAALVRKLTKSGYNVVGSAASAEDAWVELNEKQADIVLLDINLAGEKNGVWLGHKIRQKLHIPFVYLTAYSDAKTVKDVVESKPNGYLSKPYDASSLLTTLTIAIQNFEEYQSERSETNANQAETVFVKEGNVIIKIKVVDIDFIQSDGNYIKIHTGGSFHMVREKISTFIDKLPQSTFKRVHNRYIVNTSKVESFGPNDMMVNGIEIPVSLKYKDTLIPPL